MAFTVESRLGRGRSVETFAAVLEVGGERMDVVVKRARPEFRDNAAFTAALEAWGNTQKAADHEHLVAVFEAGRTPEGVYVIQEKIDGAALSTLLGMLRRRKRTLKPAFALLVAEQVAAALAYLHTELGVAHGGIDPGEVLLGYDGGVKLGDQRLRDLDQHIGEDLLEQSDRSDYLSPERSKGEPPSIKSDLYAFALVVLEALIGHPVWTAESMTVAGTLDALRDFSSVGQAQPALTRRLVEILGECLEALPSKRPASAVPVAKAFAKLNRTHGISASDAGLGKFVEALVPPPDAEEAPTRMVDPSFAEALQKEQDAQFEGASVAIDPEFERRAALPKQAAPLLGHTVELGAAKAEPKAAAEAPSPGASSKPPPADDDPKTVASPRAGSSRPADAGRAEPAKPPAAPKATPHLVRDIREGGPQQRRDPSVEKPRPGEVRVEGAPSPARTGRDDTARAQNEAGPRGRDKSAAPLAPSRRRAVVVPEVHRVAAQASSTLDEHQRRTMGIVGAAIAVVVLLIGGLWIVSGGPPRTVRLRATSAPPGAAVVDAESERLLGRTPVEADVTVEGELLRLRFELDGYEPHAVSIGSESGEVRYEAKMIPLGAER